jgi:CheY-like chemotaxis protein
MKGRTASLFAAQLVKPVKQSDLLDAIVSASAAPAPSRHKRGTRSASPASETDSRRSPHRGDRSLRVLVAEDNPTNQALVTALLTQKGHHVSVVGNGRLAADRAVLEPFDIILMDIQMPEMGGLEATAAIRDHERTAGGHVPIVALTARAMAGDREQCLAAGMDAYVSKPLRADELFATIDSLVAPAPAEAPTSAVTGPIDAEALLANFGGRADLLKQVVDVFLEDTPSLLSRIGVALRAGNSADVVAAAHALKGSVGLFSQGPAYDDARRMEHLGRSGELADGEAVRAQLDTSVTTLMSDLRALVGRL